jgi:hypothetical protein
MRKNELYLERKKQALCVEPESVAAFCASEELCCAFIT